MPEHRDERVPARSRLAIALLKSGVAFGFVWVLALLAFAIRAAFALLWRATV